MTKREMQILEWIKENPMITQQEIADRANITRSSAGVHISNLMKKGKILGKGYIIPEESYLCVIGAVNVDITGTSYRSLVAHDSNPGKVSYQFGGVGRNIAENLRLLELPIEMITVLGDDLYASKIKQHCQEIGIRLTHTMHAPHQNTSTYLCINDEHGEMQLAVSDMDIYNQLTSQYLKTKLDFINRSEIVVVDANLSEDALEFILNNCKVPVFADPVSTAKAMKIKPHLGKIHTLKPNRIEAELLSGIPICNDEDLEKAAHYFLDIGIKQVFISLGSEGVYYADAKKQGRLKNPQIEVVNTTGCGDAFMAAIVYGWHQSYGIDRCAQLGIRAAAICAQSKDAVNQTLNPTLLETE